MTAKDPKLCNKVVDKVRKPNNDSKFSSNVENLKAILLSTGGDHPETIRFNCQVLKEPMEISRY